MAHEWTAKCKDCGTEYAYSDLNYREMRVRGHSRTERCPECRRSHSRELGSIGAPYIDVRRRKGVKRSEAIAPGQLGKLDNPPRIHERDGGPSQLQRGEFDKNKFGIQDVHPDHPGKNDLAEMYRLWQDPDVQVMVAVGPTGSGKSTVLPTRLLSPPEGVPSDFFTRNGQIIVTQPRIQATRSIPKFIAEVLHGSSLGAGFDVGFRHSGTPASDWNTKLNFVTDGTLINYIQQGRLDRISLIVIDEAHERSLNIDMIIGLVLGQLPRYPRLRLMLASATIDHERFLKYFDQHLVGRSKVAFVEFPGKSFGVTERFRAADATPAIDYGDVSAVMEAAPAAVAGKVLELLTAMYSEGDSRWIDDGAGEKVDLFEKRGDVVGFLQGKRPIEECVELINAGARRIPELQTVIDGKECCLVEAMPLFTTLPLKAQDKALAKPPMIHETAVEDVLAALGEGARSVGLVLHNAKQARDAGIYLAEKAEERGLSVSAVVHAGPPAEPVLDGGAASEDVAGEEARGEEGAADLNPAGPTTTALVTIASEAERGKLPSGLDRLFDDYPDRRRVVISTNVAETSLTIHGILHVVDSGLINMGEWDLKTQTSQVKTKIHSRAGCRQRWGRAGRLQAGDAWPLYTREQFEDNAIFEAYTKPEILRSPLEQVVMTAKAAGIDSLETFPWIDAPEATELARAETSLVHKGALDGERDLTAHGQELYRFAEEPAFANLLILADRYACAVEVAALISCLRSGGYSRLLEREEGWDSATRDAVRKVQRTVLGAHLPHADDLSANLRVFAGYQRALSCPPETVHGWAFQAEWESGLKSSLDRKLKKRLGKRLPKFRAAVASARSEDELTALKKSYGKVVHPGWLAAARGAFRRASGRAWCRHHFIKPEAPKAMLDAFDDLIDGLSRHTTERERRPVDLALLDRVRVLVAHALGERTFARVDGGRFGPLETVAGVEGDSSVLVDEHSVCDVERLDALVCGSFRTIQKRLHADDEEKEDVLLLSFVVGVPSGWIESAGGGLHRLKRGAFVKMLIDQTRDEAHGLIGEGRWRASAVDQTVPLGSTIVASPDDQGALRLGDRIQYPPEFSLVYKDGAAPDLDREAEEAAGYDDDEDDGTGELAGGIEDAEFTEAAEDPETLPNEEPDWTGEDEDETASEAAADGPAAVELSDGFHSLGGGGLSNVVVRTVGGGSSQPEPVEGRVVGFEMESEAVVVLLEPTGSRPPFSTFRGRVSVGQRVEVIARAVDRVPGDRDRRLVVEEPESGFRFTMDARDVSFCPMSFVVDQIRLGSRFEVVVEEVDPATGAVRATTLGLVAQALEDVVAAAGSGDAPALHAATVAAVLPEQAWVVLEASRPADGVILAVMVDQCPKGVREKLSVRLGWKDREARHWVPKRPAELDKLVGDSKKRLGWSGRDSGGVLTWAGPMRAEQRDALLASARTHSFHVAVRRLFGRSHFVRAAVYDTETVEVVRGSATVRGTVTEVRADGAYYSVGGGRFVFVTREWLANQWIAEVSDVVAVGDAADLVIRSQPPASQRVEAAPADVLAGDPWRGSADHVKIGQLHEVLVIARLVDASIVQMGEIWGTLPDELAAFDQAGVRRRPPVVGDRFEVRVLDIDEGARSLRVSLNHTRVQVGQDVVATVRRTLTKGIVLEVAPGLEAFCPVREVDLGFVEDCTKFVRQGACFPVRVTGFGGRNSLEVSRVALLNGRLLGSTYRGRIAKVTSGGAEFELVGCGLTVFCPRGELTLAGDADPTAAVTKGDEYPVRVIEDRKKKGVCLSTMEVAREALRPYQGEVVLATVVGADKGQVDVQLAPLLRGRIRVADLSSSYVEDAREFTSVGETLPVVLGGLSERGRLMLSGKSVWAQAVEAAQRTHAVLRATVLKVQPKSLQAELAPGLVGHLFVRDFGFGYIEDLQQHVRRGHTIDVQIKGVGPKGIDLTRAPVARQAVVAAIGSTVEGRVIGAVPRKGAEIEIGPGAIGFCPMHELSTGFVDDVQTFLSHGQRVNVHVLGLRTNNRGHEGLSLSLKQASSAARPSILVPGGSSLKMPSGRPFDWRSPRLQTPDPWVGTPGHELDAELSSQRLVATEAEPEIMIPAVAPRRQDDTPAYPVEATPVPPVAAPAGSPDGDAAGTQSEERPKRWGGFLGRLFGR